ncbi:hypothetical protein N2152v2_006822 [Parachlorella kessleri]
MVRNTEDTFNYLKGIPHMHMRVSCDAHQEPVALDALTEKLSRCSVQSASLTQLCTAYENDLLSTAADAQRAVQVDAEVLNTAAHRAQRKAAEADDKAAVAAAMGVVAGITAFIFPPAGALAFLALGASFKAVNESQKESATASAAWEKEKSAEAAGRLLMCQVLPAITSFLKALKTCSSFFLSLEARQKGDVNCRSSEGAWAEDLCTLKDAADHLAMGCAAFRQAASEANSLLEWVQTEAEARGYVRTAYVTRWVASKEHVGSLGALPGEVPGKASGEGLAAMRLTNDPNSCNEPGLEPLPLVEPRSA